MYQQKTPLTRANKMLIAVTLGLLLLVMLFLYLFRDNGRPPRLTVTPTVQPTLSSIVDIQQPQPTPPIYPEAEEEPNPEPVDQVNEPTPAPEATVTQPPMEMTPQPTQITALRKGDQGQEVKTMQKRLIELGYLKGEADGDFGKGTESAVRTFQKTNKLKSDGVAGPATLTAMYGPNALPKPEQ